MRDTYVCTILANNFQTMEQIFVYFHFYYIFLEKENKF